MSHIAGSRGFIAHCHLYRKDGGTRLYLVPVPTPSGFDWAEVPCRSRAYAFADYFDAWDAARVPRIVDAGPHGWIDVEPL